MNERRLEPGTTPARLADARWPDVDRAVRRVLVLPVGSLEQHGPHLPLDTDAFLAQAIAERVHAARPGAGLAPTVAIGASGEHAHFPGTLSIGTPTLRDLVVELVRHADLHWPAVLVVNGHGGNLAALAAAAAICAYEGRRLSVVHLGGPGMDAHAGHAETSMMLHLDAARVRMDLAVVGITDPIEVLRPILEHGGVRAVSPSGVLGDPTAATADHGAALIASLVAKALAAYDYCDDRPEYRTFGAAPE